MSLNGIICQFFYIRFSAVGRSEFKSTIYTRRNTDMNLYTVKQEAWNFALQPGIGFQYMLSDGAALLIAGRFNQGFKAGNDLTSAQSYFTLNVGFAFIK